MDDPYDVGYEVGQRRAWLSLLMEALGNLGYPLPPEGDPTRAAERARWVIERERTVASLREVCASHGDNDWAPDLSLADVVEKHLLLHLEKGPADDRR